MNTDIIKATVAGGLEAPEPIEAPIETLGSAIELTANARGQQAEGNHGRTA